MASLHKLIFVSHSFKYEAIEAFRFYDAASYITSQNKTGDRRGKLFPEQLDPYVKKRVFQFSNANVSQTLGKHQLHHLLLQTPASSPTTTNTSLITYYYKHQLHHLLLQTPASSPTTTNTSFITYYHKHQLHHLLPQTPASSPTTTNILLGR